MVVEHRARTWDPGLPGWRLASGGRHVAGAQPRGLTRHAADFEARKGFTFTVLDPGSGEVIGCVYLYPTSSPEHDVEVQSWVTASRAELDGPLADAVAAWLVAEWPWERPDRHGR